MNDLISAMLAALDKAENLGRPMKEIRLHPDDFKALQQEAAAWLTYHGASFAGVLVVADETAPRLPRKPTS